MIETAQLVEPRHRPPRHRACTSRVVLRQRRCSRPARTRSSAATNDTLCHVDIPMRSCTLFLDDAADRRRRRHRRRRDEGPHRSRTPEERAMTTDGKRTFPSPFAVATPAGAEGWERMYPYYVLFSRGASASSRRAEVLVLRRDAQPGADLPVRHDHDGELVGRAATSSRRGSGCIPPAGGIDHRFVNGYLYISPNAITGPGRRSPSARRDLRAPRRPLLRELGRDLRGVGREGATTASRG